jgi:8-oxo-dGTP diphosphatase
VARTSRAGSGVGPIAAAGGVVWRYSNDRAGNDPGANVGTRAVQVAAVHRPRYNDWSLPKGHVEDGESHLTAAVREVGEEIGAVVAVQRRLAPSHYSVAGRDKTVEYWAMRYLGGAFAANDEVDELRWLPVEQAHVLLSFENDRAVLRDFAATPVADAVVVLVRHAKAGKRSEWDGEDGDRPLEQTGLRQAQALAANLAVFAPQRVLTALPLRCRQTVEPLAEVLGVPVEIAAEFSDDEYVLAPVATRAALAGLAQPGTVSVICSQGVTIPGLIASAAPFASGTETRKGAWWTLSFVDGEIIAADYYPR